MLLALGAASSLLDGLQSLTSLSPSAAPSTGQGEMPANPFDLSAGTATSAASGPASGAGGCAQISPQTMSALIAAQSQ